MEANMGIDDVLAQIHQMKSSGQQMNKKKVKQSHPQLMQNALFYFPSWEHAINTADTL